MSSTTIPTRTGRIAPRAAVTALVMTLAVAVLAVLALMALADDAGGSQARPTTAVDARDMPTPQWLERYLDPRTTDGGACDAATLRSTGKTNRGLC